MESELIVTWKYLDNGHCAFKSRASSPSKIRCNHLFTITGEHRFINCPLVQPKFLSFQRQEGLVYLIEKNPKAAPKEIWSFTELPNDREKARIIIQKKITGLNETIINAIWRKFEQLYDAAEIIKSTHELAEQEDEEEKV